MFRLERVILPIYGFVEASLLYFNKYVISVKSTCRIKKNQFFEMLEKNNIRTIY